MVCDTATAWRFGSCLGLCFLERGCAQLSPLQVAFSLPAGALASAEKPVMRDAAAALPRPSFAVPKDTRLAPYSSLPGLPRPQYAPQAFITVGRGIALRYELLLWHRLRPCPLWHRLLARRLLLRDLVVVLFRAFEPSLAQVMLSRRGNFSLSPRPTTRRSSGPRSDLFGLWSCTGLLL